MCSNILLCTHKMVKDGQISVRMVDGSNILPREETFWQLDQQLLEISKFPTNFRISQHN